MLKELPQEYIRQVFLLYAGYPKERKNGILEGGCPSCKEGRSWGKKRRLFYIPDHDRLHCKNCGGSWSSRAWISEVTGMSQIDIEKEAKDYEYVPVDLILRNNQVQNVISDTLPLDSINLNDKRQLEFYKKNRVLKTCLKFIKDRRLDTAVCRPDNFYLSLTDKIHKNRLCIPFVNSSNKIEFYQTRTILKCDTDLPKYLGRSGGNKVLFNEDKISEDIDYIFIFEGPIDAMFVRNAVAIGGVELTCEQKEKLKAYPFHKIIWVLDNQHVDETALETTKDLLDEGETVFIWPKTKLKDINDIVCAKKINELPYEFIVRNSFSGLKGKYKLKTLNLD